MRKHFERILAIYSNYITAYFSKHAAKANTDSTVDIHAKKYKEFVEKTLGGFAPFANALLTNASAGNANGQNKSAVMVDENFRRICKIYIGHSVKHIWHFISLMFV